MSRPLQSKSVLDLDLMAERKLGDAEGDVRAWQDAERGLRARVRQQLGLPKLEYGMHDASRKDSDGSNIQVIELARSPLTSFGNDVVVY